MSDKEKPKPKRGRPKGSKSGSPPNTERARKAVQLPTLWFEKLSALANAARSPIGWYLLDVLEEHFFSKGIVPPDRVAKEHDNVDNSHSPVLLELPNDLSMGLKLYVEVFNAKHRLRTPANMHIEKAIKSLLISEGFWDEREDKVDMDSYARQLFESWPKRDEGGRMAETE